MGEPSQAAETREERIRRFAELSDEEQEIALQWAALTMQATPECRTAAAEVLSGQPLSQSTMEHLVLTHEQTFELVLRQKLGIDEMEYGNPRIAAEDEAKWYFGKDWANRPPTRIKWRSYEEEALAFYEPLILEDPAHSQRIARYVEELRRRIAEGRVRRR